MGLAVDEENAYYIPCNGQISQEAVIAKVGKLFENPNIYLFISPFRRFTNMFYRNTMYAPTEGKYGAHNNMFYLVQLRFFEYCNFYKQNYIYDKNTKDQSNKFINIYTI